MLKKGSGPWDVSSSLLQERGDQIAYGEGQVVVVYDRDQPRSQLVSRVVTGYGARPDCLYNAADATSIDNSVSRPHSTYCANCQIAVVALGNIYEPGSPGLETIRLLKRNGYKVIAYEDGAHAWPLGIQCQALLAGSAWLLDSAASSFGQELGDHLSQLLRSESQRIESDARTASEMKRLGLVAESEEMITVFRQVVRVSSLSDLATLITGETGTGKELMARAIHQLDVKRRNGPFVAINCGAINPGVAESELFGHRRGAFTGAAADRRGLIRAANGGVLFLDEIGELDAGLQTKLLRVLQENRVTGVGEDQEVPVNIRVIAATNRDLKEMAETGRFRADLFHRLNLLSIHIPPLRHRTADIKPLVEHFLQKHDRLRPGASFVIGDDFLAALMLVKLPGNVRQLENVVRWTMVNKNNDAALSLVDLPQEIWEQLAQQSRSFSEPAKSPTGDQAGGTAAQGLPPGLCTQLMQVMNAHGWGLAQSLEFCEKILLESALHLSHGNQTRTAKLLGITPRSVYNKLRKHHLDH